jgi:S1-C subfamily serine protease
VLLGWGLGLAAPAWSQTAKPQADGAATRAAPPSRDAQQAFQSARDKLVQIRTLRRNTNTQSSTGSGFYVSPDGLLVTNFHVIADLALEPERHRGVAVSMDGQEQAVSLLGFDVQHDLALLRVAPSPGQTPAPHGVLPLRPAALPLQAGERIFSLGNPLDVGFAITEGSYNGLVQRSFYPRIFFGGALNPGMSGGPALDAQGRVIGVNVAKRSDAEQVSFLVPVQFVAQLLAASSQAQPITQAAHARIARQLTAHQQAVSDRVLAPPEHSERFGPYRVRVPDPKLARCWGDGRARQSSSRLDYEISNCRLDTDVLIGETPTGSLSVRYESYDGAELSPWQFAARYSSSFGDEPMRLKSDAVRTAAECTEAFVGSQALPLRAVMCLSAYRKFDQLYDMNLIAVTLDAQQRGLLMRVDMAGVNLANAKRVARAYLHGVLREAKP